MSVHLRELCDGIPSADAVIDTLKSNEILQAIDLAMLEQSGLESLFVDSTLLEVAIVLHERASVYKNGWATAVCRFTQPAKPTPKPSSSGLRPTRTSLPPSSSSLSTLARSTTYYTARCFLQVRGKIAKKAKRETLQAKKEIAMEAALVKNHAIFARDASDSPRCLSLAGANQQMMQTQHQS